MRDVPRGGSEHVGCARIRAPLLSLILTILAVVHASAAVVNTGGVYTAPPEYGSVTVYISLSPYLPEVVLKANLTDTGLAFNATLAPCPSTCIEGYSVDVVASPYRSGARLEMTVYSGPYAAARYVFYALPLLYYTSDGRKMNVIVYSLTLLDARLPVPGLNATMTVVYSGVRVAVHRSPPRAEYTVAPGGWRTTLRIVIYDFFDTDSYPWPIVVSGWLYTPQRVELIMNGTHELLNVSMVKSVYDFGVVIQYVNPDYLEARMVCFWGCSDTCRSHAAVIEVYNASDSKYLGRAGYTVYCPREQPVYVRLNGTPVYIRVVIIGPVKPELEYWVLVRRSVRLDSPVAEAFSAMILLGSVMTGVLRRSLRDASLALIVGAFIVSLVAPYIGAYRYQSLYIALGVIGALTFIVVMLRGE